MTSRATRARRFVGRVLAIAWKEVLHIRRDPRTLILALGMPVVMLLLFGYGVSFDIERVKLAVSDQDRTEASRQLALAFTANHEFEPVGGADADQADDLFRRRRARAVLVIPQGYAKDLARGGPARAQLLLLYATISGISGLVFAVSHLTSGSPSALVAFFFGAA